MTCDFELCIQNHSQQNKMQDLATLEHQEKVLEFENFSHEQEEGYANEAGAQSGEDRSLLVPLLPPSSMLVRLLHEYHFFRTQYDESVLSEFSNKILQRIWEEHSEKTKQRLHLRYNVRLKKYVRKLWFTICQLLDIERMNQKSYNTFFGNVLREHVSDWIEDLANVYLLNCWNIDRDAWHDLDESRFLCAWFEAAEQFVEANKLSEYQKYLRICQNIAVQTLNTSNLGLEQKIENQTINQQNLSKISLEDLYHSKMNHIQRVKAGIALGHSLDFSPFKYFEQAQRLLSKDIMSLGIMPATPTISISYEEYMNQKETKPEIFSSTPNNLHHVLQTTSYHEACRGTMKHSEKSKELTNGGKQEHFLKSSLSCPLLRKDVVEPHYTRRGIPLISYKEEEEVERDLKQELRPSNTLMMTQTILLSTGIAVAASTMPLGKSEKQSFLLPSMRQACNRKVVTTVFPEKSKSSPTQLERRLKEFNDGLFKNKQSSKNVRRKYQLPQELLPISRGR